VLKRDVEHQLSLILRALHHAVSLQQQSFSFLMLTSSYCFHMSVLVRCYCAATVSYINAMWSFWTVERDVLYQAWRRCAQRATSCTIFSIRLIRLRCVLSHCFIRALSTSCPLRYRDIRSIHMVTVLQYMQVHYFNAVQAPVFQFYISSIALVLHFKFIFC